MTTESGIVVTKPKYQGVPNKGTVFAIGEGVNDGDRPLDIEVKVGDRVVFEEPNPRGFKYEGKGLFKLHKSQILGVFDD